MRSTPLRCYETLDDALADLWPIAFPVTRAEERVWVRSDRAALLPPALRRLLGG